MRVPRAGLEGNGGLARDIGIGRGIVASPVAPFDQGANDQKHAR
jgi:hypothetical protein